MDNIAKNKQERKVVHLQMGDRHEYFGSIEQLYSKYSKEELEVIVKECVDTEEKVKTGQLTDTLSVELLLIKFSS